MAGSGLPLTSCGQREDRVTSIGAKIPRIIGITCSEALQERKLGDRWVINRSLFGITNLCVQNRAAHVGKIEFRPGKGVLYSLIRDLSVGECEYLHAFIDLSAQQFIRSGETEEQCPVCFAFVHMSPGYGEPNLHRRSRSDRKLPI